MGFTSGAGTAHSSGAPEFPTGYILGSCYSIFSCICNVLEIVVFTFIIFSLCSLTLHMFLTLGEP